MESGKNSYSAVIPKTCASCGTDVPRNETHCALCDRAAKADPSQALVTMVHWLVFLVVTAVILLSGYALAP